MTREQLRCFQQMYFCGCGNPEAASGALMRILATFEPDKISYKLHDELMPDAGIQMLMLYFIDHARLIEHGGSVSSSWLTALGEGVLSALRNEEADGFVALNKSCCVHGYDVEGPDADTHDCGAFDDAHPDWDSRKPETWRAKPPMKVTQRGAPRRSPTAP